MTLFSKNHSIVYVTLALCLTDVLIGRGQTSAESSGALGSTSTGNQYLHLPEIAIRDPWILADSTSKTYYLYASNDGRMTGVNRAGTMVYRSKDLINWERPSIVFTVPEGIWAADQPAWAPEVHKYNGRFYLFTTLHNPEKVIAQPPEALKTSFMRGTVIAVSDSPESPFTLLKTNGPVAPSDFMSLDGTFYVDLSGKPWMVYAHEWVQKIDGTMEAVPLKSDLSDASGPPIYLFKGPDAPWLDEQATVSTKENHYVTDGPELFRTKDGHLLMLWASFENRGYVETVARSRSGEIHGPWDQLPPLVRQDSGHGMLFRTFDGQLMLIIHHANKNAHAKLFEISDEGDHLKIIRQRTDLDGG